MKLNLILFILAIDCIVYCENFTEKYEEIKSCYRSPREYDTSDDLTFVCTGNVSTNFFISNISDRCTGGRDSNWRNVADVHFENCERPRIPPIFFNVYNVFTFNISNLGIQSLDKECSCPLNGTSIGHFIAAGNQLSEISHNFLSTCLQEIFSIDLSNNKIQQIYSLMDFLHLEKLNLAHNQITDLMYALPKTLKYLDSSHNKISQIPITTEKYIKILNLSHNEISFISGRLSQLADIEEIDLSFNKLDVWRGNYIESDKLEYMNLSHNEIKTMRFICGSALKLTKLDLSYNKLKYFDENQFCNNINLKFLDLSHNLIEKIHYKAFAQLFLLKDIKISHNNLQNIEPYTFFFQQHLSKLDFSYNNISTLDGNIFSDLMDDSTIEFISVEKNPIKKINGLKDVIYSRIVGFDDTQFKCDHFTTSYPIDDEICDASSKKINCILESLITPPSTEPPTGIIGFFKSIF